MSAASIELRITQFIKDGGPLSKRISLNPDGTLKSDGSACVMARGKARRILLSGVGALAQLIESMRSNEALGLGDLRPNLPTEVEITTKPKLNGTVPPNLIARTAEYIVYETGKPAFALLDYDNKDMPPHVAAEVKLRGGFYKAMASVIPPIVQAARLRRSSTSAGLYRTDTREQLPGSNGVHLYVGVTDGTDIPRFLAAAHERCWLAGFGWKTIGAAGQLLDRSIVDRSVGQPERLVFEGPPVLEVPLAQDVARRRPAFADGELLDTLTVCPPLMIGERDRLQRLQAKEARRLAGDAAKARAAFIDQQAKLLVARTGMAPAAARHVVEQQCEGVLLPSLELPFDDDDLRGCTVADVLADPQRFVGATLADPLEGVNYGAGKAKIMQRADGSVWIHSFAHGRTVYELKFDAATIETLVTAAADEDAVELFVRLAVDNELADHLVDRMRKRLAQRCGVNMRAITKALQERRQKRGSERRAAERQRRLAERDDPRPRIESPADDSPFIPVMTQLNEVFGAVTDPEPPMRDVDGAFTKVRVRRLPNMHALTAQGANAQQTKDTRLPAPEQPLLTRQSAMQMAEEIERYVDFFNPKDDHSVHLATEFVKHYLERPNDTALPLVAAVTTTPLVLPGRQLLAPRGLLRERGIVFRIPQELMEFLPEPDECDSHALAAALDFLTDEWLCDVASTFQGKCTLISLALTILQRSLLPNRPAFWVTAPQRGGGKTTALIMVLMAVTGISPAAAAWSPHDEERRKALFAYLLSGIPCIIWDNIPRGELISCPHIERSCTTAWYSDRLLGVSQTVATAAATIHAFTGNNCGPKGDLASRSIGTRLVVSRIDPENRDFRHQDPIAWTEANRGKILNALYTILLADTSAATASGQLRTRFKIWWQLIGAPLEEAARATGRDLDFALAFLSQEADEPEAASLAEALDALRHQWRDKFTARDLARFLSDLNPYLADTERERANLLREFLFPKEKRDSAITAQIVGIRLRRHLDAPAIVGNQTLQLIAELDQNTNTIVYQVRVV
jgi:hypothetical protein